MDWTLSQRPSTTHLQRLALHYFEFLETTDFSVGRDLILDWIQANPPFQKGYWLDCWNSYAVSIRCVCWMQWLARFSEQLQPAEQHTIVGSLSEQIRFLARNLESDIRGNHLIKNIKCLLWAASFFDGRESADWGRAGRQLLQQELHTQFLSDGMHFELSPAYHCQVFADLLECCSVLDADARTNLLSELQPAAQVIADLAHPDTQISLFSDGGLHMAYLPEECLQTFEQLAGHRPNAQTEFEFADSGYVGQRTESTYFLMDCGPACADSLPAHGHADILAFEWDVDGLRFIVDAGVYEYETGTTRMQNRSVASHNTVQVADRDQCEFVKSFRVGRRSHGRCESVFSANNRLTVTASHDGYSLGSHTTIHRRTCISDADGLKVKDEVSGNCGEPAVSRLLLHHDCRLHRHDAKTLQISRGNSTVRLTSTAAINIVPATWSSDFGVLHETHRIEMEYGSVPCHAEFQLQVIK